MIIRPYIGNQYEIKSLDYIKGVLHTYAELNVPESNLTYDYDLFELGIGSDVYLLLSTQEDFKDEAPVLTAISSDVFTEELKGWLFKNGDLNKLHVSKERQGLEAKYLYDVLSEAISLKAVHKIGGLSESYHFGVHYDYYALETEDKWYLLYFLYTD